MKLIYARESMVEGPSLFLAGPTPRSPDVASWRPEALALLEKQGFEGAVYVPEDRTWAPRVDYDAEVSWETLALEAASVILFWVPRDLTRLPGLTTNDEWGHWKTSGKVVFGSPPWAVKVAYQRWWAERLGVPLFHTLEDTCRGALELLRKIQAKANFSPPSR